MKALLVMLSLFSFVSTQVQAGKCQLTCDFQKELERISKKINKKDAAPMPSGHECCHGKDGKQSKEGKQSRKNTCMGELGGQCYHEIADSKLPTLEKQVDQNSLKFFAIELSFLSSYEKFGHQQLYRPKIPRPIDDAYLKFKSSLRLHILKDQFLI